MKTMQSERRSVDSRRIRVAVVACTWICALACAAPLINGAERNIYVSVAGSDSGAGSQESPFATLGRAQREARQLSCLGDATVKVLVGPGVYSLSRPLTFTPRDSGRDGHKVIYASAEGPGRATIIGSIPLKGWVRYKGGIWKVKLPPGLTFHTLYEDGHRAYLARFPNRVNDPRFPVASAGYLVSVGGSRQHSDKVMGPEAGVSWLTYGVADAPPREAANDVRVQIFPGGTRDWVREVHPVLTVNRRENRIIFKHRSVYGVGAGARFFLENDLAYLDSPGEFWRDKKNDVLYYFPYSSKDPNRLEITAPLLNCIVRIEGNASNDRVSNLEFRGFTLAETDEQPSKPLWDSPGPGDASQQGAIIWMTNTNDVRIVNCHLKDGGLSGIMLVGDNSGDVIAGDWIQHMGLNGVSLWNRPVTVPTDPQRTRCDHNEISDTLIDGVGELQCYAECVTVFNASYNTISNCVLRNSVRYGITLRGNTGPQYGPAVLTNAAPCEGNVMKDLFVSRCGQDSGDMGALHAAAVNNPGGAFVNTFEQIVVADTWAVPSMKDRAPNGVFLDWPRMSMGQVFRDVDVIRSQGIPFRTNGPENARGTITDNVSWKPGFQATRMNFAGIGLTGAFPSSYKDAPDFPRLSVPHS